MSEILNCHGLLTGRVGSVFGSFACKIIGKLPSIDPTQPVNIDYFVWSQVQVRVQISQYKIYLNILVSLWKRSYSFWTNP